MLRLRHHAHGLRHRPQPVGQARQRRHRAGTQSLRDLQQRRLRTRRRQEVHRLEVVRHVAPLAPHSAGAPDIAFANLHHAPPQLHPRNGRGDHARGGQRVQNNADATDKATHLRHVSDVARARHVLHRHAAQQRPLVARPRRGVHVRPRRGHHLRRRKPDPARGSVHQDALAGAQPRRLPVGQLHRHENRGGRRRRVEADARRHRHHQVLHHIDMGPQAADGQAERREAHAQAAVRGANLGHDARAVASRVPRVARVHPENVKHVAEVQAHAHHPQLAFPGPKHQGAPQGGLHRLLGKAVQRAARARHELHRLRRLQHPGRGQQRSREVPAPLRHALAVRRTAGRVSHQRILDAAADTRARDLTVKAAAEELGAFLRHRTQQTAKRSAADAH